MKAAHFYSHCNNALYAEAKRILSGMSFHDKYKEQALDRVLCHLEQGKMMRTNTGGNTVSFSVHEVQFIVDKVLLLDEV